MLQGILAFEWFGLSGNAWFTIVVVLLLFAAMIFSKLRVDIIFLLGMCALYLSGVLDLKTTFGSHVLPHCHQRGHDLGRTPPLTFCIGLMISVNSSFATPIVFPMYPV